MEQACQYENEAIHLIVSHPSHLAEQFVGGSAMSGVAAGAVSTTQEYQNVEWTPEHWYLPPNACSFMFVLAQRFTHQDPMQSRQLASWSDLAASLLERDWVDEVDSPDAVDASTALSELERHYTIRSPAVVQKVLQRYAFLMPVISEASERIPAYFPDSTLYLWVIVDPEVEDEEAANELVVAIATPLDVPDAMERRERLADEWWLGALPRTQGRLSIDLEFI